MRIHAVVAAAVMALPCVAQADFEGVLVSKMTGSLTGTQRTWVSAAGIRGELEIDVPKDQQATMGKRLRAVTIVRSTEADVTYILDEDRKAYVVLERKPGDRADPTTYAASRLGPDRVAGFACEKVALTGSDGQRAEMCVSPDFIAGEAWFRAFRTRAAGRGEAMSRALRQAGANGIPIRWTSAGMGNAPFTVELVSAERRPVPASSFAIPPGYVRTSLGPPAESAGGPKQADRPAR